MKFKVIRDDITNMCVDAIVLPANKRLKEGSGTSKAIFEKAGRKELVEACKRYNKYNKKIEVGCSVPTRGFGLNADYILHTVVPKWRDGKHQEYELLSAAYLSALNLADDMHCKTIAFPLLASGNNGFNSQLAWAIAKESIETYVSKKYLQEVFLIVYDQETTVKLKVLGVNIEENIDASYTIENDEKHIGQLEKTLWEFLDTGKEMGEEFFVKICDPDVQRELIKKGADIVLNVMKDKIKKI